MKKFINSPKNIFQELLEGYALAYQKLVRLTEHHLVVRATRKQEGKVGLVAMAGSGHEPGVCGFVGQGMLDIAVQGEIFAAPGPARCLEALKLAERGAGVLFLVLNHTGDLLTANATLEKAGEANLNVKMMLVHDDCSIASRGEPEKRRGLVGCLPLYKIAGAAAEQGRSLEEVHALAERMGNHMSTLGVASRTATHPSTGEAMFAIGENEMEVGMGIHGEPGTGKTRMKSADETAAAMVAQLLNDLQVQAREELLVIVNGAGATSLMELFIIYRKIHQILMRRKIAVAESLIGEFMTTQEQAGFSIFFGRLDPELRRLWSAPCHTPFFKR